MKCPYSMLYYVMLCRVMYTHACNDQIGHIVYSNLHRGFCSTPVSTMLASSPTILSPMPNAVWITSLCKALPCHVLVTPPLLLDGFHHVAMMLLCCPCTSHSSASTNSSSLVSDRFSITCGRELCMSLWKSTSGPWPWPPWTILVDASICSISFWL
jgi:hypothetical protein